MKMQIIIAASYQFYLKILLCTFYVNTVKGKLDKVGWLATGCLTLKWWKQNGSEG